MRLKYIPILLLLCHFTSWSQISNTLQDSTAFKLEEGEHRGGSGFKIAEGKYGSMTLSFYVLARYLNQMGIDDHYTNHKGETFDIDRRNDLQFQKSNLYFRGWVGDPKLRYTVFVWTSNATLGQGAQVVVAGNLQYKFNRHFELGIGINGLPSVRSILGQWPEWLRSDARPIADEYFRGSFTTGIYAQGEITDNIFYKTMLGNNLSQLGVDAGQLDNKFDTWSGAIWWTTNNFGRIPTYGDYEKHKKPATILGGAYTRSTENRQSQPDSDAPENSQIRLSDGTGIFAVNAFAPNTQVIDAKYQMTSINTGVKYNGYSFDAEFFMRWLSDFKTAGEIPVTNLFDSGFSLQGSAMLVDKKLQLYSTYAYINGDYGKPWEVTCGLNWFPFKTKFFRINPEVMYEKHSPVGYLSYPTQVGSNGIIGMLNIELNY
ncbi:hypothetical protein [Flavobacterium daemonense]|uniref:hypothetical protein n=1 Tax=Flavobacterium daemonense TaxID=1393049 RepID=UPI001185E2DA|nr:hypothetical protein [Flavobacterium daemonense]KAF2336902.1 hypothetical protein FND99_00405 [Flavobacterium daemonense]